LSQSGRTSEKFEERLKQVGVEAPAFAGRPTVFWDVFGEQGHPVRATVSDLGPLMLARILTLNDTQEGVLTSRSRSPTTTGSCCSISRICARCCSNVADNAATIQTSYGNVSAASIARSSADS